MRVLLLGEYSRLHNTLKEGLTALGHEVTLLGDGDGFKGFPVDLSTRATIAHLPLISLVRKVFYRLFKIDFITIEQGFRFWSHLDKLKNFDAVQLINERPIKTTPAFERFLLKKLFKVNPHCFLLSCGADTFSIKYMLAGKPTYSVLTPFLEDPSLQPKFQYMLDYLKPKHQKTHDLVVQNIKGIIASDFDYVAPLQSHAKFKGLVPNPVNYNITAYTPLHISEKINIFLGVNEGNRVAKGIGYFEKALDTLPTHISEKINIIKVSNVPYATYISLFASAHIVLDQVYSYDQGYNALEAMAQGKVVFTGAESDFQAFYGIKEDEVCINALPNVDALQRKLIQLIEHPEELVVIGDSARKFILANHDYKKSAQRYIEIWEANR